MYLSNGESICLNIMCIEYVLHNIIIGNIWTLSNNVLNKKVFINHSFKTLSNCIYLKI